MQNAGPSPGPLSRLAGLRAAWAAVGASSGPGCVSATGSEFWAGAVKQGRKASWAVKLLGPLPGRRVSAPAATWDHEVTLAGELLN